MSAQLFLFLFFFSWGLSPCFTDDHCLSLSLHGLPSVHVCVLISSSYKDNSQRLGPTLWPHFKSPFSRFYLQIQSHSVVLGVRTSTYKFGRGKRNLAHNNRFHYTKQVVCTLRMWAKVNPQKVTTYTDRAMNVHLLWQNMHRGTYLCHLDNLVSVYAPKMT